MHVLPDVETLADLLGELGIHRVLIITDPRVQACKTLREALVSKGIGYTVYEQTKFDDASFRMEYACRLYLDCACEGIIGLGDTLTLDYAEEIGARVADWKGILKRNLLMVAIPTTAEGRDRTEQGIGWHRDDTLRPRLAVLNAEYLAIQSPSSAIFIEMDVLSHMIEEYIARTITAEHRAEIERTVPLIFENLEEYYRHPEGMTAGKSVPRSTQPTRAFSAKAHSGYIHAMAHSLASVYRLPHGFYAAMLLPHVLTAYGTKIEKKLHRLGVRSEVALESDRHREGARTFISAIKGMNARMGIPRTLSELQMAEIPALASRAAKEANPMYAAPILFDALDLEQIYRKICMK